VRWIAALTTPIAGAVRLMLYDAEDAVWLFQYDRAGDTPSTRAERFADVEAARAAAAERFGVARERWVWIPDPRVGDRDDLIAPRRAAAEGCGG
jgi:hypothetical protein